MKSFKGTVRHKTALQGTEGHLSEQTGTNSSPRKPTNKILKSNHRVTWPLIRFIKCFSKKTKFLNPIPNSILE
jgi:hypothetical protein